MGLSFHYNGSFSTAASLTAMIEEVKDIADMFQWEYTVYDNAFPEHSLGKIKYNQKMYGISFTPPECETVWLCFLSNGKMSSPVHLHFYGNSQHEEDRECLYTLAVKTQYAGIEIHKLVIQLLKHISRKYLIDFNMTDEGQYWETGDEKLLEKIFNQYTFLIDGLKSSIETYPISPEESYEAWFKRLLKQTQENYRNQ